MDVRELGIDSARLGRIAASIEAAVAAEQYDGAVVLVARRGEVALHEAIGFAERASGRPAQIDDVFHLFSITKTFTAAAVLQCVDDGRLQLTTPIAEIIPEFAAKGKQRINVAQLLSHQSGLPPDLPFITPDMLGSTTAIALAVSDQALIGRPGQAVTYSPIGAFAVLGEIVRRLDPRSRSLREIMNDQLFQPLGMRETCLSLREDLAPRLAPVVVRDPTPGIIPPAALESINMMLTEKFEMPGASAIGTAHDLFRWAEALRCGGALGGGRVLSPALLNLVMTDHTGSAPNHIYDSMCEARGWASYPSHLGLGFFLRGDGIFTTPFGLTASAETFGGLGAGSAVFWADPLRELVFVCLTTGVLEDSRNFERMQGLSDLALGALVD
jgi:CubicO group peptidase (beta-lactamase class C family)